MNRRAFLRVALVTTGGVLAATALVGNRVAASIDHTDHGLEMDMTGRKRPARRRRTAQSGTADVRAQPLSWTWKGCK
jgi:hypothetical protein